MIQYINVSKKRNNFLVLDNVSFEIENNTTTVFIGSKYSGKTELVKTFSKACSIDGGKIDLGLNNNNEKCSVSIVFSDVEQNIKLTVSEYLRFYSTCQGIELKENDIDELLSKYKLLIYKNVNYDDLSIYTKKIVSIVKSLINDPDIWVIDAPLCIVNDDTAYQIKNIINNNIGKRTIIFTSNNFNELVDFCDNIGILNRGSLLEFGDVSHILDIANLSERIELLVDDNVEEALSILRNDNRVRDITYENKTISFSFEGDNLDQHNILKLLIDKGINVYSYKKDLSSISDIETKLLENKNKIVIDKETF